MGGSKFRPRRGQKREKQINLSTKKQKEVIMCREVSECVIAG